MHHLPICPQLSCYFARQKRLRTVNQYKVIRADYCGSPTAVPLKLGHKMFQYAFICTIKLFHE